MKILNSKTMKENFNHSGDADNANITNSFYSFFVREKICQEI
jgi:hypothetical protein